MPELPPNPPENRSFRIPLGLGVDIGGSKIALALGDASGRVRRRLRRPTDLACPPEVEVARIVADARRLLDEEGVTPDALAGVGVSAPGPLDAARGVLLEPPNLPGWREVAVCGPLAEAFARPVALENDANAAALAEWRFGAGRGRRHVAYLTMSTGVGAGLVLDGRLYRGRGDAAGEIGHAPIVWDGEPCACGQRGCLEAYVGGAAWTRRLRAQAPDASRVLALAGARSQVTPEHVIAAARAGDAFACAEVERFVEHLARGIVLLAYTLAPEVVVLGTIAAAAGEALCFAPLRRRVAARLWPTLARELAIVPAALGEALPDLAGLCVAFEASAGASAGQGA